MVRTAESTACRVSAVVPCFNRWDEVAALWGDLCAWAKHHDVSDHPGRTDLSLRVVFVDNGSTRLPPALEPASDIEGRLGCEVLRLERNLGGSGGFNAGLRRVLDSPGPGDDPDYLWLLDSDCRVGPETLDRLVAVLEARPDVGIAGAALADPVTGVVHEVGGRVDRRTGRLLAARRGLCGVVGEIDCDYVASCCALVRRGAVIAGGLLPDLFLHADDVTWCLRVTAVTGLRCVGVPGALAGHPSFDRFAFGARYYVSRNCLAPVDALGLGRGVRFGRAAREGVRAAQAELHGRHDLARLHLLGLKDALSDLSTGPAPRGTIDLAPPHRLEELPAMLVRAAERFKERGAVSAWVDPRCGAADEVRHMLGATGLKIVTWEKGEQGRVDLAVVRAGSAPVPAHRARVVAHVSERSVFLVDRGGLGSGLARVCRAVAAGLRGGWYAARFAMLAPGAMRPALVRPPSTSTVAPPTLSVVLLSHNRWSMLRATLARVLAIPGIDPERVIVSDNASTDHSAEKVEKEFPGVRVVRLEENLGVAGFNRGVSQALTDLVLVLDDDAWPEPGVLESAVALLGERPDLAAVALHPKNPRTKTSEWAFAEKRTRRAPSGRAWTDDRWPIMGCGNVVRTDAWRRAGGYEGEYFLYRNDVDLALKVLALPELPGVHFNPEWVVWHDSPAALPGASKSVLWHRLATRNWVWTARRHGSWGWGPIGAILGWVWAHRLARGSYRAHAETIKGMLHGMLRKPPRVALQARPGARPTAGPRTPGRGAGFSDLMRLRLGMRRGF